MLLADLEKKKQLYEATGVPYSWLRIIFTDGTSANCLYRAMRWCVRYRFLLPFGWLCQLINKWLNHCLIGLHADFGPGFVLVHPVGVVINSKVKGGTGVIVESGVVIGDEKGISPTLGDSIFVGAGAKIIGGVRVGSNAKIGANAVVVHDVPAMATVVGIPAKVIKQTAS